jgi:hypothetical protein
MTMRTLLPLAAALAGACSDDPQSGALQEAVSDSGRLTLDVSNDREIAGRFTEGDTVATFSSRFEPGVSVSATIDAGDAAIAAWYDAAVGEHGAVGFDIDGRLGERERAALAGLGQALADIVPFPADGEKDGPPHVILLRDYSGFLSEWTSGATDEPVVTELPDQPMAPRDPGDDSGGKGGGGPLPTGCGPANDDDGITLLPMCCNGGAVVPWQHDASNHCFTTMANVCGAASATSADPLATSCPGRCGPGCAAIPVYTQDCLDHDLCLMHHTALGSLDPTGSCGDELGEAVDDVAFLYGAEAGFVAMAITGCGF